MGNAKIPNTYFFVTGAPRSGTTFMSDWICTASNAYCVHEVVPHLQSCSRDERLDLLMNFANSAADRLKKPLQREFLVWDDVVGKTNPAVLGIKNPWIWNCEIPESCIVELSPSFLERCIVMVRHPFDMVASGFERGLRTKNWPNYSAAEHSLLYLHCSKFLQKRQAQNTQTLVVHHEELLLDPSRVQLRVEEFLGISLSRFSGHEHTEEYFEKMRSHVSRSRGNIGSSKRTLLSNADRATIRALVGELAASFGYDLSGDDSACIQATLNES